MMLPTLLPMLATSSDPFDSPDYRFETKWDGVRALAAVDANGWRLWGRDVADYTPRYPDLAVLRRLPAGTLVDGELVAAGMPRPTLAALLRRHHLADPWQIRLAARWCPVCLVLFDLLCFRGRSLLDEPFRGRHERLAKLCATLAVPELTLADGVIGNGRAFFAAAIAAGHEGVVAKRLDSAYRPGRRSPAWRKIKPRETASRP
jgi:bifunctional non-homologous end joining protein LigD